MIKEANAYLDEYRAAGDIADPGFRRWFKHAEASLSVGLASTRQERRQMKKAGQY